MNGLWILDSWINRMDGYRTPARRKSRDTVLYVGILLFFPLVVSKQGALIPLERQTDQREYCEADTFQPVCQANEVVVVTYAWYGRQDIGRCVQQDYGFVGCKADVLTILDNKCSGRRTCEMRMPDTSLDALEPCPQEFRTYLNTSYKCVKVDSAPCQMCHSTSRAKTTSPRGYLASVISQETEDSKCGSANCPWLIEVQPGQKINVTLFDFGLMSDSLSYTMPDTCFRYAVIKEIAASRDRPVCGGKGRKTHVYLSVSNSVEVHIVSPEVFSRRGQFLLYYEAIGCPDRTPPKNTYIKREDDTLVVGCMSTGETWTLKCNGTQWVGETGPCPLLPEKVTPTGITLPLGVLIAIVVAIALVIGVLILTVGVVCLKRQQNETTAVTESAVYVRARQDPEYRDDLAAEMYLTAKSHPYHPQSQAKYKPNPIPNQYRPAFGGQVNLYSHNRMVQRPLPSIPNIPAAAAAAASSAPIPPMAPMARQDSVPPIPTDNSCSDDDPKMIIAEIHRTNSQASSNNYQSSSLGGGVYDGTPGAGPSASACATMVAGPRRPRAASARSQSGSYSGAGSAGKDDPQYFVLDPDELTGEDAAAGDRRAARAALQHPADAHGGGAVGGAGATGSSSSTGSQKSPEEEENEENADKETHLNNSCHEIPLRPSRETPQSSRTEINNTGNTSWP